MGDGDVDEQQLVRASKCGAQTCLRFLLDLSLESLTGMNTLPDSRSIEIYLPSSQYDNLLLMSKTFLYQLSAMVFSGLALALDSGLNCTC